MSDLNWQLRDYLHELRDDGRLFVLLSIYLHRNIRNRSWPSYDTIQAETGYGREAVSRSIKWLIENLAFARVPYSKRIGEEKLLGRRKNIYQLTGVIVLGDAVRRYMFLTPEGWKGIVNELKDIGESSLGELLESSLVELSHASDSSLGEPKVITGKSIKDSSAPSGAEAGSSKKKPEQKPRERNPVFDAVAQHVFEIDPAEANGEGGRIGAIAAWLAGTSDGIKRGKKKEVVGFISRPAAPEHVQKFATAWKVANPTASLPLDFIKFVDAWRKWATQQRAASEKRQIAASTTQPETPLTPEEQRQLAEEMRNVRPAWEQQKEQQAS